MIAFSFGNEAFNKEYTEQTIEILVDAKTKHQSLDSFAHAALDYLDEEVYPGEGYIDLSYEGFTIEEKQYKDIILDHLLQMNHKIDVHLGEIKRTYRIKKQVYDPYEIVYIVETDVEYILIMWATTA